MQQFVTTLLTTPPFDRLQRAINVFRIDVSSTDATFCTGGIRRLLVVNTTTALSVAASRVPQFHMAMVMVNSTVYGGSGGQVAVLSRASGADEIALHEMGHRVPARRRV